MAGNKRSTEIDLIIDTILNDARLSSQTLLNHKKKIIWILHYGKPPWIRAERHPDRQTSRRNDPRPGLFQRGERFVDIANIQLKAIGSRVLNTRRDGPGFSRVLEFNKLEYQRRARQGCRSYAILCRARESHHRHHTFVISE